MDSRPDIREYLPSTALRQRLARDRDAMLTASHGVALRPPERKFSGDAKEEGSNLAVRKTGTTVLGIRGDSFVVLAGDRRVSWGWYILSHDAIKTTPITSHSAVAAAGTSGIIQLIERQLKQEIQMFRSDYEMEPPVSSQAKLLRSIIQEFLSLFVFSWDLGSIFIFAGYDTRPHRTPEQRPILVWFDEIAGSSEDEATLPYIALGSGMKEAHTTLDDVEHGWRSNLTREEAVTLAVRAIWASGRRDPGTESVTDTVPIVLVIDENGITVVPERDINGILTGIMKRRVAAERRQRRVRR